MPANRQGVAPSRPRLSLVGSLLVLAATVTLVAPSATPAPARHLAVLELSGALAPEVRSAFTDQLRAGALEALQGQSISVMTRENMAAMARDMGLDLSCVESKAECEVDVGRNLGAALVVSGSVVIIEGSAVATVKLHETAEGMLLASETARSQSALSLLDQLSATARALLVEGLHLPPGRAEPSVGATEARIGGEGRGVQLEQVERAVVRFTSDPEGAAVLVDGQMLCPSTPCSRTVEVGQHSVEMQRERHWPASSRLKLTGNPVRMTLKPQFGWLSVETAPVGLEVSIDGAVVGAGPIGDREVAPGVYEVVVSDRCWVLQGERVMIEEGERQPVRIAPSRRVAGIEVSARDDRGADVAADVYVDSERVGRAPGAFEVPLCAMEVELRDNGRIWTGALSLREGEVSVVEGRFAAASSARQPAARRVAKKAPPGDLRIVARVPADIYLDGSRAGMSPLTLRRIPAGEHELRVDFGLRSPRTKSYTRAVVIAPGEVTRVFAGWSQLMDLSAPGGGEPPSEYSLASCFEGNSQSRDQACMNVAATYEKNRPPNWVRGAIRAYESACRAGRPAGCEMAKLLALALK